MDKFKLVDTSGDAELVVKAYQHVESGGYLLSVDNESNLTLTFGFYGLSDTAITLSGVDLEGMIAALTIAKNEIEQQRIVRRLKG